MSDLAIIQIGNDMTDAEAAELRDTLTEVSDETGIRFVITSANIEVLDERDLKEYLGHLVSILDYELNEQSK